MHHHHHQQRQYQKKPTIDVLRCVILIGGILQICSTTCVSTRTAVRWRCVQSGLRLLDGRTISTVPVFCNWQQSETAARRRTRVFSVFTKRWNEGMLFCTVWEPFVGPNRSSYKWTRKPATKNQEHRISSYSTNKRPGNQRQWTRNSNKINRMNDPNPNTL